MKPIRLTPVATRDLREATAWYHARNEGVALRFAQEVHRTLEVLEKFSSIGALVPNSPDKTVRRLSVHTFPYHVIFVQLETIISVVAIAHDRRKPGYWLDEHP
ncbi:MAG: plasmid stabilization system protein [Acidobacteria bacterium]|nr:plasmid stabilization system protein [Acidobacteriota bacterium]